MLLRVYRALRRRLLSLASLTLSASPPAQNDSNQGGAHGASQIDNTHLSNQINLALGELALLTRRQLEFQRETRLVLTEIAMPPTAVWRKTWDAGFEPTRRVFNSSTICR